MINLEKDRATWERLTIGFSALYGSGMERVDFYWLEGNKSSLCAHRLAAQTEMRRRVYAINALPIGMSDGIGWYSL